MFVRFFNSTSLKTLTLLAICCLLPTACQSESQATATAEPQNSQPVSIDADLDEPFTLSVGESTTIRETGIGITFEKVEQDGRCPSAVQCVEEGPVVAIISAVQDSEQPTTFTMNPDPYLAKLSGMPPNMVTFQGYEIELTAVDPFPEQPEDLLNLPYTATLIVHGEPSP